MAVDNPCYIPFVVTFLCRKCLVRACPPSPPSKNNVAKVLVARQEILLQACREWPSKPLIHLFVIHSQMRNSKLETALQRQAV